MIKIHLDIQFKQAIKIPLFQVFMVEEMGLKPEELKKLLGCGSCLSKLRFLPRSIQKINDKIEWLISDGLLNKIVKTKPMVIVTTAKEAHEWIDELKSFEKIYLNSK